MTLREIIERSNATCKRLVREEDGVVLGVMVVTLMSLFLMAAATFAVGEHIRDRIEIQNAVDAAAYSAAVVEADTISRVAAINQAMAWTYIQMCRRHMEYIQDKWLEQVYSQYMSDRSYLQAHVGTYRYTGWDYSFSSYRASRWQLSNILINGRFRVSIGDINTAKSWWQWETLGPQIATDRINLSNMARAEDDLISGMPARMKTCAQEVLRHNLGMDSQNWVTIMIGRNDSGNVGGNHFESYDKEKLFLGAILPEDQSGADVMGDGSRDSEWFPENSSQPWRRYVQQGNMLRADWDGYADGWMQQRYSKYRGIYYINGRRVAIPGNRPGVVLGQDVRDGYFDTQPIRPRRLNQAYFEDVGGIVVACARSLRHPFQLFINNGGTGGFYDAFREAAPTPRCMMAVASARAGYMNGSEGEYNPFTDSNSGGWYRSAKNLGETDWDAVLMPIRRVWASRTDGKWKGDSGADVLSMLWNNVNWEPMGNAPILADYSRPGTERNPKPIRTGFGKTSAELSKSLYH